MGDQVQKQNYNLVKKIKLIGLDTDVSKLISILPFFFFFYQIFIVNIYLLRKNFISF